eukprot:CAMPEP_0194241482 /NCGR_PEP_ID=MMETSP0158-20130606/7335_1 /TAXON_ID=33649 /ORGANISM="Thalassionema nitzschioides, Strain L26-B" /LENGTH=238 /DNA_ID=CAMNT_0038976381 /DNA_START=17 /DNA_END=730 /DNA_ORIENTATION=+
MEPVTLPFDFQPSQYHVICGKGKKCYNHAGNKLFREIVDSHIKNYSNANTKLDKSIIVSEIIYEVRSRGGFVKQISEEQWNDVGDEFARERVGQTIRDRLHNQYRSSTAAKQKRRQQAREAVVGCNSRSKLQSQTDFTFQINQLRVLTEENSVCDKQLLDVLTQTNLSILNELTGHDTSTNNNNIIDDSETFDAEASSSLASEVSLNDLTDQPATEYFDSIKQKVLLNASLTGKQACS